MAKIITNHVVISVSKLAKDGESDEQVLVSDEVRAALEQVVAELVGDGLIVEIQ